MNIRINGRLKKLLLLCMLITLISCSKNISNEIVDENKLDENLVNQCISASLEFEKKQDIELKIDYIDTIIVGQAGYAYLLDADFNILEHPNQEYIGINLFDITGELFVNPLNKLVEVESHLFYEYEFDNIENLIYFYKSRSNQILVITGLNAFK
ncbi:MAG: hypothetical protein JEZ08_20670 [Clostridiales bacterium]|nr:hypothetical protein [Clostridiales bacterium]